MNQLKTIIIEDIISEVALIKNFLEIHFPDIEVLGNTDNVQDGVALITKSKPDFVLMDIEIMDGTSYDILNNLQKNNVKLDFEIIFLTGNRKFEYATMAFAYTAIDFLTKPVEEELFVKAIENVISKRNPLQFQNQIQEFMDFVRSGNNQNQRLAIRKIGGIIEFVTISNIVYLEADKEITNFYFSDGTEIISSRNLGQYDKLLIKNHAFFPISNSILVNINEIKSYDHTDKSVHLNNGLLLYASRRGGIDLKNFINAQYENQDESFSMNNIFNKLKF